MYITEKVRVPGGNCTGGKLCDKVGMGGIVGVSCWWNTRVAGSASVGSKSKKEGNGGSGPRVSADSFIETMLAMSVGGYKCFETDLLYACILEAG
jgi:hypothetical protein